MTKMYCVYWIHRDEDTNYNTSGYIGITSNLRKRIKDHSKMKGSCRHLYHALSIYKGKIALAVITNNLDEEAACLVEEMLRPTAKIGWNIKIGGLNGTRGLHHKRSAATAKLISDALRGRVYPQLQGKNNPNFVSAKVYKGTSIVDGSEIFLHGKQEILEAGFTPKYVYSFVNGKFPRAHYNKYIWEIV